MSIFEQFSLLGPKTMRWAQTVKHTSASCAWDDLAGALGMGRLQPLAYTLGRAKYCDDLSAKKHLNQLVLHLIQTYALRETWRSSSLIEPRLASLACYEILHVPLCPKCHGSGFITFGVSCNRCHGVGYCTLSSRARYRFIGTDKRNWQRRWHTRYERVFSHLMDAERQLSDHLNQQLHHKI